MLLSQNDRFQKELKEFRSKIESITDVQIKEQLQNLLSKLIKNVRDLDDCHKQLYTTNKLPVSVNETKSSILELRQELAKKLKEWEDIKSSHNP